MGNYRNKLSEIMPIAWFYKLKAFGRLRNSTKTKKPKPNQPRTSTLSTPLFNLGSQDQSVPHTADHTFCRSPTRSQKPPPPTHFVLREPPRRSSKKVTRPKNFRHSASVTPRCSSRATAEFLVSPHVSDSRSSCRSRVVSSTSDIVIEVNEKSSFEKFGKVDLPPILGKHNKHPEPRNAAKFLRADQETADGESIRRTEERKGGRARVKLRTNSPRIGNRKIQGWNGGKTTALSAASTKMQRRSISESMAITKSSSDPQRDFRESMVEMIGEYNIRAPQDLEVLLARYLALNSDDYHDLIVKVFQQIWFALTGVHGS